MTLGKTSPERMHYNTVYVKARAMKNRRTLEDMGGVGETVVRIWKGPSPIKPRLRAAAEAFIADRCNETSAALDDVVWEAVQDNWTNVEIARQCLTTVGLVGPRVKRLKQQRKDSL